MSSSAGLQPLPTHIHHSTQRLTHRQAHTLLSTFLERAENDAAYRPDSTLTERGPQALSSSSAPNLTLSHLKRILSGIEGRRVGGGVKALGEEGENVTSGEQARQGIIQKVDGTEDNEAGGLDEAETATSKRYSGKNGKRPLEVDDDTDMLDETPKPKKQKQKIVTTSTAERSGDPSGEAVLQTTVDTDDWQDPTLYALGQDVIDNNDAPHNGQGDFDDGAEDVNGDNEDITLHGHEEGNEIEEARNPNAGLKQPHSRKEEKELVSIMLGGSGKVVDPEEQNEADRGMKKKKTKKSKGDGDTQQNGVKSTDDAAHDAGRKSSKKKDKKTPTVGNGAHARETQSTTTKAEPDNVQNSRKPKKSASSEPLDEDNDGDVPMSSSLPPSAQPPRSTEPVRTISKDNKNKTNNAEAELSKAERKRLKKMRHNSSKKDREEIRMAKKT